MRSDDDILEGNKYQYFKGGGEFGDVVLGWNC